MEREYSPKEFVGRDREIEFVLNKADALMRQVPVKKRTTIFMGTRGTGKSWLLAHLKTKLKPSNAIVFSFDLKDYDEWDPTLAVIDVLTRLSVDTAGPSKGLGVTPSDMSRKLTQHIRPRLERQILVLLVDHVYESNWKLLAAMEDYLLGPLATEPRVLIVMAGRGRPYLWKTPELRFETEFWDLEPFKDEATTKDQLERLQLEEALLRAGEIHKLSGGNPLANLQLAVTNDPATALDTVIDEMLMDIPAKDRPRLRKCLEAVCVLRSFDEERILTMLVAYHNNDESSRETFDEQARNLRKELVKRSLAHWGPEQGGYILDELMRKLLDRYMREKEPGRWSNLHEAAAELYKDWANKYQRTQALWKKEHEYHNVQLQSVHEECPTTPGSVGR